MEQWKWKKRECYFSNTDDLQSIDDVVDVGPCKYFIPGFPIVYISNEINKKYTVRCRDTIWITRPQCFFFTIVLKSLIDTHFSTFSFVLTGEPESVAMHTRSIYLFAICFVRPQDFTYINTWIVNHKVVFCFAFKSRPWVDKSNAVPFNYTVRRNEPSIISMSHRKFSFVLLSTMQQCGECQCFVPKTRISRAKF